MTSSISSLPTAPDLSNLSYDQKEQLVELLLQRKEHKRTHAIEYIFPETGPRRRELYWKHLEFFKAGKKYRQRALIAANRVGKSFAAIYEMTLHLTGDYPEWWVGYKFDQPTKWWAAGFKENVKSAIQEYLLGNINDPGTGFIPKDKLMRITRKQGAVDTFQDLFVLHKSGGLSQVTLKTYDEKTKAFQGATVHGVLLDEEPEDPNLYAECFTRLATTQGIIMCSFTPLKSLSETVLSFLDEGKLPDKGYGEINGKYIVNISWDDVPHLDQATKDELLKSYLPHQRDARTKGIPALGSGAIYPVPESEVECQPFKIPDKWPRAYGLDVGWHRTAAVFGAYDEEADTWYLYSEYYRGQEQPAVHAEAIRSRGEWLNGAIDPAANQTKSDGQRLMQQYEDLGLRLYNADNSVEAGLLECLQRLGEGRLKIFSTLRNVFSEYRIYRRDERGRIVKRDDHLMDAMRYLIMSGRRIATIDPVFEESEVTGLYKYSDDDRSEITGC